MQVFAKIYYQLTKSIRGAAVHLYQSAFMKYLIPTALAIFSACTGNGITEVKDNSIEPPVSGIPAPQTLEFSIVAQHPHDTAAYTQGLELYNGKMYESTGDYENSSIRITDWKTGVVKEKHMMGNAKIFGEGITIFKNKIYQLTWQSNTVYVYDLNNIKKAIQTFKWPYEGWGVTHNDKELIISDGSANLYFVDPETFKVKNTISVVSNKGAVSSLNELEWINGFVFANIYTTNDIVKIDPESGHVVAKLTLDNMLTRDEFIEGRTDVLNGIAYDSALNTIFVTGKRWPKLFELKLR